MVFSRGGGLSVITGLLLLPFVDINHLFWCSLIFEGSHYYSHDYRYIIVCVNVGDLVRFVLGFY